MRALLVGVLVAVAACSSSAPEAAEPTTTTTTPRQAFDAEILGSTTATEADLPPMRSAGEALCEVLDMADELPEATGLVTVALQEIRTAAPDESVARVISVAAATHLCPGWRDIVVTTWDALPTAP